MKKILKNTKGITLIALVITIIVLLILAGVTIATLTGENGILTRASDASRENEIASVKEQARLDISNWVAEELENGRDATVNTPEKVKEILDTANQNNENKYYVDVTEEGVQTPNGYIVSIEELYTTGTGGGVTKVTTANYGDRVDYVSKKEEEEGSSLIWRIFYTDENYVYLISSKEDGSNTIESCTLGNYINDYTGSVDITDSFLQSLNSQWFNQLGTNNTLNNAKAVAYLMNQNVWNEYKDNEKKVSYAIGGPTLELYINSFNESEETTEKINILNCTSTGYQQNTYLNMISKKYNNEIYNNGTDYWLASSFIGGNVYFVGSYDGKLYGDNVVATSATYGLRPMVIIPKSNFTYQIIEESE